MNVLVTRKKTNLSFLSTLFFFVVIMGVVDNVVACVLVAVFFWFVLLVDELCMLSVNIYGFHVAIGSSFVIGAAEMCHCFGGLWLFWNLWSVAVAGYTSRMERFFFCPFQNKSKILPSADFLLWISDLMLLLQQNIKINWKLNLWK